MTLTAKLASLLPPTLDTGEEEWTGETKEARVLPGRSPSAKSPPLSPATSLRSVVGPEGGAKRNPPVTSDTSVEAVVDLCSPDTSMSGTR